MATPQHPTDEQARRRRLLVAVRYVLPVVVAVIGLAIFAVHPNVDGLEGAASLIGAGLSVLLINLLFRAGVSGDRDRAQEAAARRFFDVHGRWPDEPGEPPGAAR